MPKLKGLSLGAPLTGEEDQAIKVLVALHLVRSYGLRDGFDAAWENAMAQLFSRLESGAGFADLVETEERRRPSPAELTAAARRMADARERSRVPWIETQSRSYNNALDFLRPLRTQLGHALTRAKVWFITSDSPVVLRAGDEVRAAGRGLPVANANTLFMPLTKNVVVSFTSRTDQPLQLDLNADGVRQINDQVARAAARFFVLHLEADAGTCLTAHSRA